VTGVSCMLKWPNDLIVRSRKIAGFLAEATYRGSRLDHLIVGLGVNVNIKTTGFPKTIRKASTSLSYELGREVDRTLLTKRIIEEIDKSYVRFEKGHTSELLDEARQICSTLGRKVHVITAGRSFIGHAVGLGDDGHLLVRLNNGATFPFYAADVVHVR
jgi:BirA family biotin operon repressor/biotin-[acetyl-CoA-carboxylase] ligase